MSKNVILKALLNYRTICFSLIVIPTIAMYVACFPGWLQVDHQASVLNLVAGTPDELHSLLWTLLAYPLLYLSPSYGLYGIVQLAVFTSCAMWSICRLDKIDVLTSKNAIVLSAVYGLSPTFLLYNQLWSSDIIFCSFSMVLVTQLIELVKSAGECIERISYMVGFVLTMFMLVEMRKNAILIPIALVVLMVIRFKNHRRAIIKMFSFLLALYICIGLTFSNVIKAAPSPKYEVTAMASNMIARAIVDDGSIPDDVKNDLNAIRPMSEWKRLYQRPIADNEKGGTSLNPKFIKDFVVVCSLNVKSCVSGWNDIIWPYYVMSTNSRDSLKVDSFQEFEHADLTVQACTRQIHCDEKYYSQFYSDSRVKSWMTGLNRNLNENHVPVITDAFNLLFFNTALPLWTVVIGLIVCVRQRKHWGLDGFIIIAPLTMIVVSLLLFSSTAVFRYALQGYYMIPLLVAAYLKFAERDNKTVSVNNM